jgi:hypothetical protein
VSGPLVLAVNPSASFTIPTPFEPNISVLPLSELLPVRRRRVYLFDGETPYAARHWNTAIARRGGDAYLPNHQAMLDLAGAYDYPTLIKELTGQGYAGVAFQTEASSRRFGRPIGLHMFGE